MPKEKVKRTMNYVMSARIRGEIAQQHISIAKACEYAGVSKFTLYKLFDDPTEYFPNTQRHVWRFHGIRAAKSGRGRS